MRKVPVAHTAQAFPFSYTGKEEGNLLFTEAFPFVIKFTLDWVLVLQQCWEQRRTSAESRPPLLWAEIFRFSSKQSLSALVYRCQTWAKKSIKHGWRSPWCLSNGRHWLLLPASRLLFYFLFFCKNWYLFPLRKLDSCCHPRTLGIVTRFFSGVCSAKAVNINFFTINWVKGGDTGFSCICSDFKIFCLMRLTE